MAKILSSINSKFILSLNDHPDIREAFKPFTITPVTLKYTVAKNKQCKGEELLIKNFKKN